MTIRLGKVPLRERVSELEREYAKAQNEMIGILSDIDLAGFGEVRAMAVRRRIDRLIVHLNAFAVRWSVRSVRQAYQQSAKKTEIKLQSLGAKKRLLAEKHEKETVAKYADQITETLFRANGSIRQSLESYMGLMRRAAYGLNHMQHFSAKPRLFDFIDDIIRQALLIGESMQKTARIIRDRLIGEIQRGQIIRVGNRNYRARYYAEMVARTEMRDAQSDAVRDKCAEYDNDLVEVSDHGTVCPICKPYEGRVYSLSGKSLRYPKLPSQPPWHPNCEHHISPTSEIALEFREKYG
jgi:hypothetical protein